VTVDLAGARNFGGPASFDVKSSDGYPSGSLQQFNIATDGTVIGVFSNGEKLAMGQVALANFNNPQGLEKIGSTTFRASTNSGIPQRGTPAAGGRGTLLGGVLEMSNVDLAAEFTNLIVAQRGFQANSRVITSSDEMLTDLVNIKR
jgi:flagellar hook protein FlgE